MQLYAMVMPEQWLCQSNACARDKQSYFVSSAKAPFQSSGGGFIR